MFNWLWGKSTPPPPPSPPPSPPNLINEWRKLPWGNKERDLEFVRSYEPYKKCQKINFLLHGPAGSGKSSFINSVDSALQGRMAAQALVNAAPDRSFTLQLTTYQIQKGTPDTVYPFVFADTMGLERGKNKGVGVEDIKLVMKGHMKHNYKFNPASALNQESQSYNEAPTENDHIHVLVCVINAAKVDTLNNDDEFWTKMKDIRLAARDLMIPEMAILTHIDEACPDIQADIKNVYKSRRLKEKMEQVSQHLGVPLNCIYPVKNYHCEIDTDDDIDVLILNALKCTIHFGEDFANKLYKTHCKDETKEEDLNFVKTYQPRNRDVKHLRILLHGPVGAGKSSFINSVESALRGQITSRAEADGSSGSSFTRKYKTYRIRKDEVDHYSFVFNDIMGYEKQHGVTAENVKLALRGHVREEYEFEPGKQLTETDEGYSPDPSLDDRVHVLVYVVPTDKVSLLSREVLDQMREVRLAASKMGIPQLAILTKVDEACSKAKSDLSKVYKTKYTHDQVEKLSKLIGIQPNCIFLVKNYHSESKPRDDIDALILYALRQMINRGEDFLNN